MIPDIYNVEFNLIETKQGYIDKKIKETKYIKNITSFLPILLAKTVDIEDELLILIIKSAEIDTSSDDFNLSEYRLYVMFKILELKIGNYDSPEITSYVLYRYNDKELTIINYFIHKNRMLDVNISNYKNDTEYLEEMKKYTNENKYNDPQKLYDRLCSLCKNDIFYEEEPVKEEIIKEEIIKEEIIKEEIIKEEIIKEEIIKEEVIIPKKAFTPKLEKKTPTKKTNNNKNGKNKNK